MKRIFLSIFASVLFVGCDSVEERNAKYEAAVKTLTQDSIASPYVVTMPDGRVLKRIQIYRSSYTYDSIYYFEMPSKTNSPDTNTISINSQSGKVHQTIVLDGKQYNLSPK